MSEADVRDLFKELDDFNMEGYLLLKDLKMDGYIKNWSHKMIMNMNNPSKGKNIILSITLINDSIIKFI